VVSTGAATIPASAPLSQPAAVNLKTLSISELAIAIEHFNKDNLSAGCLAVEELLNWERFSANAALSTVSDAQQNECYQLSPGALGMAVY